MPASSPPARVPSQFPRERTWLICILAAFAVLSLWYSVTTPLLESFDEPLHIEYVMKLAQDRRLPFLTPEQVGTTPSELAQPPLYYALAAAVSAWAAEPGAGYLLRENPYMSKARPSEQNDNRNRYVHRVAEDFPYRGNVLAIHLMRALSILFGIGSISVTYGTAKALFPALPALWIGAAALQAFIPSFVNINAVVNNDGLLIFLSSLALLLMVRVIQSRDRPPRSVLMLGAVIGLATLTKLNAMPMIVLAGLALLMHAGKRDSVRRRVLQVALLAGAFLVVTGWWFVRNAALYGDPFGTFTDWHVPGVRQHLVSWDEVAADLRYVERSFWASFQRGRIYPDERVLWFPRLLALAGLSATLAVMARTRHRWQHDPARRGVVILFAAWMALYGAGFVWWMVRTIGVTGRLVYPLLVPLVLAVSYGLHRIASPRGAWALAVAGGAMLVFAAAMPPLVIGPANARPRVITAAELSGFAHRSDLVFGGIFRLHGYSVSGGAVDGVQPLTIRMAWEAIEPPQKNYTLYVKALGLTGQLLGDINTYPGRGSFVTQDWAASVIYDDAINIYTNAEFDEAMAADLVIGWFDTAAQKNLPARSTDGKSTGSVVVGRVRALPSKPALYAPAQPLALTFGDLVELSGFDRTDESLTLYWRARRPLPSDYTVFVHVLDAEGRLLLQRDGPPASGAYPTSLWQPGETVRDERRLAWPKSFAAVRVGLYNRETGERLTLPGTEDNGALLSIAARRSP